MTGRISFCGIGPVEAGDPPATTDDNKAFREWTRSSQNGGFLGISYCTREKLEPKSLSYASKGWLKFVK
jgi:hypothetical protein